MRALLFVALIATLVGSSQGLAEGNETHTQPESTSVAEPETVAVATRGILYLFGNRLEPPFVFTIYDDTLWVNDYYFMGKAQPKPKSKQDSLADAMHDSVYRAIVPLLEQEVSYDSILSRAAELYETFERIDSARVIEGRLLVWKSYDRHPPVEVLIPHSVIPPPQPFVERLRGEAKLMTTLLNMGGIEIRGSKFCLSVPARDLAKVEALIEKVKEQERASEEDERALHAPPGRLEELINPRALKKRGEKQ